MPEKLLPHLEKEISREQENYTARVLLHFERHGERDGELLTADGQKQMFKKGQSRKEIAPTVLAVGSPKERAQHSAALDLAGAERRDDITGKENLEDLRKKLDQDRKVGSRIAMDERLDFNLGKPAYNEPAVQAYDMDKGLVWTVEQSDQLAESIGEKEAFTYSRLAGGLAELVKKYTKVAENYQKIINTPEKLEQYGRVLERIMGSHTPVIDSLLCKLVEKVKGEAERDKLIKILGDGKGLDTGEGFDIEIDIKKDSSLPTIRLKYAKEDENGHEIFKFDEEIPMGIIEELIEEGKK